MSEISPKLHAWDLDGTLREGSLVSDAIVHAIEEGILDGSHVEDPAHPTLEEIWQFVVSLPGRSRREFQPIIDKLSDEAKDQAYPWAIERLKFQMKDGHAVIASMSPDFLVRAFAKGLGMPRGMGSYYHTSGLVFSGRAVSLNKTRALRRYMREHGIADLSFAAGDTEADLPMLELANQAVVVNPEDRLAEIAIARSWEIVHTNGNYE